MTEELRANRIVDMLTRSCPPPTYAKNEKRFMLSPSISSSSKDAGYSLVALRNFVHATRDSGYKNISAAVAELIDNALQASANEVRVFVMQFEEGLERQLRIAVMDNGTGMNAASLQEALRFGGSERFGDRAGLGRYGMGLPNSSMSQARRVDVISWQAGAPCLVTYLDLDEVARGVQQRIPSPVKSKLPAWAERFATAQGTLVIWSRCDRLSKRRVSTIVNQLQDSLAQVYRCALSQGVKIAVNSVAMTPVDPLFRLPTRGRDRATIYGEPLVYEIATAEPSETAPIIVRFTELPVRRWCQLADDKKREMRIIGGAGVSILRSGREIDYGWHLMGSKRRENYDDWWRCEIEFSPKLDELFGVTHSKQGISPTPELKRLIAPDLEKIARVLNARARAAFADAAAMAPSPAERRAERGNALLLPLASHRFMRFATNNCGYRIQVAPLSGSEFFDYSRRGNAVTVRINEDHPFYGSLYTTRPTANGMRSRFDLDLMLLAAARAALANRNTAYRRHVGQFIRAWSDSLSTFADAK